jgi:hypothetical protein
MRDGSIAALASRTLGVAPVLRPATPSLFEPEGSRAGLREIEIMEGREVGRDSAPTSLRAPARAEPAAGATRTATAAGHAADEADAPLLGFFEADLVGQPARQPVTTTGTFSGVGAPGEEVAPPAAGIHARGDAPAGLAALARVGSLTPDTAGQSSDATAPATPGEPAEPTSAHDRRPAGSDGVIPRSSQKATTNEQTHHRAEADHTEPALVVRIGRVEVRAVHAPAQPPAAPATRARPPAGPSLAEHLLARDRGRK